ncbi:MAG: methylglyoxal synthase, partial [Firmicutes bacterium]|nr:methylglyoxal synthase [Bacillota bacterium]
MRIALIAHDKKKPDMIALAIRHKEILSKHEIFATGTTGKLVIEATGLPIRCMKSGPLGGDQQIGSMVACSAIDLVIF